MFMSITLPAQRWTVQHLLRLSSSRFRLLHFFFFNQLSDFFLCTNFLSKNKSTVLSYRFFFKVILHCETWNVIGLFPSYKLEKIGLLLKPRPGPGPRTRTLDPDPEEPGPWKTWQTAGYGKMIRRPHIITY